jgi:hypothetical protein
MPSPFPGMDPYIESWIWSDFHARLIPAVFDRLSPQLPERYLAVTELFIWRVSDQERLLMGGPDVLVSEPSRSQAGPVVATIAAPINTVLPGAVRQQKQIRVIDRMGRRVVTVIEFLSPSNKSTGDDGEAYRLKRDEYIGSVINLVEIDLLRAGMRPPLGDPAPPIADYYLLVHRASSRGRLGIWPFSVRDPFPPVPVPLDADVADVMIDLKPCIDHVYDVGRYASQLNYSVPPAPPLREPDATWARELLSNRAIPPLGAQP